MSMMFATPTAPTRRETAPSPRNRLLRAPCASARAVRAAEGWLTLASSGDSGLAGAARTDWTAAGWLVTGRAEIVGGGASKSVVLSAAGRAAGRGCVGVGW